MMKDDVFIASLVQYGFLDQVYSRIKNELRYLPDMNELRMVVSAADSLSRHYIEMGSNPVTEEEALEFIEDCSKYPRSQTMDGHWKSSIPSSAVHLQHPLTTIRRV